ncbi:uncharacterized protein [Eurosta solidaginis]|uniref:uncharacterized protein n=1 Tax=Eurosta solidaginis TaxID=178769 RepID=UPI003530C186
MSPVLEFIILGFVLVLCLVEFVQADENENGANELSKKFGDIGPTFKKALDNELKHFKETLESDGVKYIELARIPRDDGAAQVEGPTSELAIGIQHFLDDLTKLKKAVVDDSLKNLFFDFRQSLEAEKAAEADKA